ncbi:MAG: tRNA (adenosine(37)-N6)-threonylcarbamoyltransferase complex ATPase subunit type 1 TsaE [Saprospirales bacterium]|nr:tRNA (adenosine(37)-N6)-threonylcarbamoyltransferase complex ATPase subunit type 1 TsaE [Saprospirales bacterium]MBK8489759.1 tRNA (adenosine(37)-N6)-threonylcarbamoyltransferase complex ATPase subunit type 1 TsaE [Saprospirales bacterium]
MNTSGPIEFLVYAFSDWDELAERILAYAGARRKFFLYGEMGAGKTTLTQAVCRRLGAVEGAVSPSFALVNEYHYRDESGRVCPFYHLDLFRLKDEQEALDIGIEDYLYGEDYCFVEWPDLIEALAPEEVVRIQLITESDSVRKVLFL